MGDININQKHEKQMQAMVYAIENYPTINRTKLMKFIFFMDLFAYNNYGDTLFENTYYCLQRGPVPYYGFDQTSSDRNDYFTISKNASVDGSYYYSFMLNNNILFNNYEKSFTEQEIQLMRLTLHTILNNTATDLSDKTHKYDLWNKENIGHRIDMKLFSLSNKEKHELNSYLGTARYVSPINVIPNNDTYPKKYNLISSQQNLPVTINRKNGDII